MLYLLILACFLVSGITGLIYQVLWTRMIVGIIGSSPFSVTIVLAVFMAGLGLGSAVAGKTVDRVARPEKLIRVYGLLELGIGLYCLLLPLLLLLFKPLYAWIYNRLFDHFLLYNLLTFAGCALVLILPATFMGATLPVLSRFFVNTLSRVGTHVGRLYGLNTIGSAAGSLLCGFWLINLVGVRGVLAVAVLLNALLRSPFLTESQVGEVLQRSRESALPVLAAVGECRVGQRPLFERFSAGWRLDGGVADRAVRGEYGELPISGDYLWYRIGGTAAVRRVARFRAGLASGRGWRPG